MTRAPILEDMCYRLSARGLKKLAPQQHAHTDITTYAAWRDDELGRLFTAYFDVSKIRGRDVVDFGCGTGELCRTVAQLGAASVTGVEMSERMIKIARERPQDSLANRTRYALGEIDSIPLSDGYAEVILCFDVVEHISKYEQIITEWHRVLRPGGQVLICWQPWMHPWGHHNYPLVNVPWAHLFLSDASLMRVCERTYESPHYQPSFWHLEDGRKKPNPYIGATTVSGYLNKLTTWRFERICSRVGFRIVRGERVQFTGERLRWLKRLLASIPYVSDAFCSCVVYELERNA